MGLFDRFKKKQQEETAAASVPVCPELTAIAKCFDDREIKYTLRATESMQQLSVIMAGDNGKKETYLFNCGKESGLYILGSIPQEVPGRSHDAVKELMNQLNMQYRFFYLHYDEKQRTVDATYQVPKCVDNPGEIAFEILARMSMVLGEATAAVNSVI